MTRRRLHVAPGRIEGAFARPDPASLHYLSDVLGGYGLGASIFAVAGMVALIVTFIRHNPASR